MESLITICGMDRRQKIRRGFLWASGDFKKEELADAIGAPRTRFSSFLHDRCDITDEQMDKGEAWLKDRAYWSDNAAEMPAIDVTLAEDLEALAKVLKASDYPRQLKARKFKAWISLSHDGLDDLVKAILRGS